MCPPRYLGKRKRNAGRLPVCLPRGKRTPSTSTVRPQTVCVRVRSDPVVHFSSRYGRPNLHGRVPRGPTGRVHRPVTRSPRGLGRNPRTPVSVPKETPVGPCSCPLGAPSDTGTLTYVLRGHNWLHPGPRTSRPPSGSTPECDEVLRGKRQANRVSPVSHGISSQIV